MKDSWKNKEVFLKQLEGNLKELNQPQGYPQHWNILLFLLEDSRTGDVDSILEVGCGVGAISKLLKRHLPQISYHGLDYSEDAIEIAKENWGEPERFFVKDFWDLQKDDFVGYDLVLESAMIDVMPNGDEAVDFLLKLQPKRVYFQRLKLVEDESYYTVGSAYDTIQTCQYHHNLESFESMLSENGYAWIKINLGHEFYGYWAELKTGEQK